MKLPIYIALALSLAVLPVAAQKKAKPQTKDDAYGSVIYTMQDNETKQQARENAIKRAQKAAIEEAFGKDVSSIEESTSTIDDDNGSSSFRENINAISRGEWIDDNKAPVFTIVDPRDPWTFKVEVWGKIREITEARAAIEYTIMNFKNEETTNFYKTGETGPNRLFLDFKSPVSGNLVVYLVNPDDDEARLMLPYKNDERPSYPIEKGVTYNFFKGTFKGKGTYMGLAPADKVRKKTYAYQLYVIFSPNPISTNIDNTGKSSKEVPVLSLPKFRDWLAKARATDRSMDVRPVTITLHDQTFDN